MTITEAQKKVDAQIQNCGGYWRVGSMFLRLIEEVGELARAINIKYGDKKPKSMDDGNNLEQELVDTFYTTLALSNYYKINFNDNIPNYLNIDTRDDISKIQNQLIKENVDKLMIIPKLVKRIGDLSELIQILENNIELNYNITNMVVTIIDLAADLNIDLSTEFVKKVDKDESKKELYTSIGQ
jgi:NTP pyrophosphatase (non-canonical NTP hydrolase)